MSELNIIKSIKFSTKRSTKRVAKSIARTLEIVNRNWVGWNNQNPNGWESAPSETNFLLCVHTPVARELSKRVYKPFGNNLFWTVFDKKVSERLCFHLNLE